MAAFFLCYKKIYKILQQALGAWAKKRAFVEKVLMLSQNINKAFTTTYATSIHMKVKLAPVVCEPGTENHYYTLVNKLEMHPVMLNGWLKALQ